MGGCGHDGPATANMYDCNAGTENWVKGWQRTRSNGAALMDTRGARKTPPWSQVLGMEPARTEGPLLSVLPWQAKNRASCHMRWPHRESTTMRCPGEGQGRPQVGFGAWQSHSWATRVL